MSQKSHKVRVERSGATLGRRRVVNLLTQVRVYPRAGGARALPDVGRCSTWCRDPPSHVLHARRARRWRARVSRRRGGRPGGGTQRTVQFEPIVVHSEAAQRARVALLSVCGVSVGYQGGRNARIAFRRPRSNLLLEDSMPVGNVPSRATQLPLKDLRIHSNPLWRL